MIRIIESCADCDDIEKRVVDAVAQTVTSLKELLASPDALQAFAAMKFELSGLHPIEERRLNLIEQINQTFTYLASVRAARWLLEKHPETVALRLNLGTAKGSDIESLDWDGGRDGSIVAETFASVNPNNNDKLAKDIARVSATGARYRYVFYICPAHSLTDFPAPPPPEEGVRVVSLGWVGPSQQESAAAERTL